MTRVIRYAFIMMLLSTSLVVSRARAENSVAWSMAAPGCTIDPGSASKLVETATGGITFASTATGYAYAYCPIQKFSSGSTDWELELTNGYTSSTAGTYNVTAFLSYSTVAGSAPATPYSANGNTGTSTQYGEITAIMNPQSFTFLTYYYWVVVQLYRQDTTHNPVFYGTGVVNLDPTNHPLTYP